MTICNLKLSKHRLTWLTCLFLGVILHLGSLQGGEGGGWDKGEDMYQYIIMRLVSSTDAYPACTASLAG